MTTSTRDVVRKVLLRVFVLLLFVMLHYFIDASHHTLLRLVFIAAIVTSWELRLFDRTARDKTIWRTFGLLILMWVYFRIWLIISGKTQ
jgi:hypothetical protein